MLNFLDDNVWRALLWNRHSFSERAVSWFEQASDEQCFFCRFTKITVLRLLTAERVMGTEAQSMAQAWNGWDRVWTDDRLKFLPGPDDLEREFRLHSRSHSPSPKVWADAYLLAFAAVTGLQLVTFDRAIKPLGGSVLQL